MEGIAEQLGPALKENVELQLEAEFRKRLAHVHAEIKRRLDYASAMATTTRRIEQVACPFYDNFIRTTIRLSWTF